MLTKLTLGEKLKDLRISKGEIKGQHNPNDKEYYMRTLETTQSR